jgi:hypothetical protein
MGLEQLKPWEEDWKAFGMHVHARLLDRMRQVASFSFAFTGTHDPAADPSHFNAEELRAGDYARARLAAQSPRMAQLLIRTKQNAGVRFDDWFELEAILRDAGVIE